MNNDEIKKLLRELKTDSAKEAKSNRTIAQGRKPPVRKKVSGRRRMALWAEGFFDDLRSRGIAGRELFMIVSGILLLMFIIWTMGSAIFREKKSVNVTADEGLTVTVEQQPSDWCNRAEVVLGIRTKAPIQEITVNGINCSFEAGKRAKITVEAQQETLDMMVVSEEQVMHAQMTIPMLDSEKPLISVNKENGQITLNAVDSQSGLEGIYYGTVDRFSEVPQYQRYTGPFLPEDHKTYYYYAADQAGNKTIPLETTMEPAESLSLNQEEASLFPGQSFDLRVLANPVGAYYNNLLMTNKTPSVIRLDTDGTVTALQEGIGVIEVTADGLPAVNCEILVRAEAEITISALGDCTLGTDINFSPVNSFNTVQAMYGNSYFFQNVREILSKDDITFANFEGTLTTLDTRSDKLYAFKGDPSFVSILQEGSVEAVTLANNHSSDYGAQSKEDTKQYLRAAGIDYCDGEEIIVREVNGVKVGLIGIYVLDTGMEKSSQVEQTLQAAKEAGASVIVVAFHWGEEKSTQPDQTQQALAHLAIDCGADLVVGHHPHVLQGIEQYHGHYIAYSLGNFCFGGNSAPSDMDTMIFQQTFTVSADGAVQDGSVNIIPCSVSSELYWNNYQPTPATGNEAERILEKINTLAF